MNNDKFEQTMRSLEYYHNIQVLPGAWTVIRVDGRSFSKFTLDKYEKPFDINFHNLMVETSSSLLKELGGIYAFTESDEISILLPKNWDLFDRSLEKIISISASIASSTFTHLVNIPVQFDSRVWIASDKEQVIDYFNWRQADTMRCALNGWSYWTLRKLGNSARKATSILDKQTVAFKNELLFQNEINFNELPLWQRRGTGLYWETYEKEGYNPIEKKTIITQRSRIKVNEELPMKDEYSQFIAQFIN